MKKSDKQMKDKIHQFLCHTTSLSCAFYNGSGNIGAELLLLESLQLHIDTLLQLIQHRSFSKTDQQKTTQNYSLKLEIWSQCLRSRSAVPLTVA